MAQGPVPTSGAATSCGAGEDDGVGTSLGVALGVGLACTLDSAVRTLLACGDGGAPEHPAATRTATSAAILTFIRSGYERSPCRRFHVLARFAPAHRRHPVRPGETIGQMRVRR